MGEGGQIWLKCITGDLIMMIRDKNNIFERVENFHADLAWNYPVRDLQNLSLLIVKVIPHVCAVESKVNERFLADFAGEVTPMVPLALWPSVKLKRALG